MRISSSSIAGHLVVANHGHGVLQHLTHVILELFCRLGQHHHAIVVDVEDVVLVHNPPAEDLCGVFSNPETQRPAPHEHLQQVRRALLETFGLDAVWVRFGPEHGEACGAGHCNNATSQQDWCRLYHEEPVTASTGREKGQEVGHCDLQVDRGRDLSVRDATETKLPHQRILIPAVQKNVEQIDRGDHRHEGLDECHGEEESQVPNWWCLRGNRVVIANGDESTVIEQGDEHQHEYRHMEEWRPLVCVHELGVVLPVLGHVLIGPVQKHRNEEEGDQLQGGSNAVGEEAANAAPDA